MISSSGIKHRGTGPSGQRGFTKETSSRFPEVEFCRLQFKVLLNILIDWEAGHWEVGHWETGHWEAGTGRPDTRVRHGLSFAEEPAPPAQRGVAVAPL